MTARKTVTRKGFNLFRDRLRTFLRLHGYAMFSSLGDLWRAPLMTLMTLMVIAVTLALPLTFYLTLANLQRLSGSLDESWKVSLYLDPKLDAKDAASVLARLRKHEAVATVRLIDKESGLAEFRRHSGFGEVLEALPENPLPVVIEVSPHSQWETPERLAELVTTWEKIPEVDFAQWNMRWLQRLRAWLQLAERGVLILGALLSLTVLLVVGNTIRLELENRHEEIEVMKLLGATHRFIRRPFIYSGFWYGASGGLMAQILVWGLSVTMRSPAQSLAAMYGASFEIHFLSFSEWMGFSGLSVVLGILGSWLVVTRHLWRLRV